MLCVVLVLPCTWCKYWGFWRTVLWFRLIIPLTQWSWVGPMGATEAADAPPVRALWPIHSLSEDPGVSNNWQSFSNLEVRHLTLGKENR